MKFREVVEVGHGLSAERTTDVRNGENADFRSLLLLPGILTGLERSGFKKPSPVQLAAIPIGKLGLDMIVQAKSGTGKTCVFVVLGLETVQLANKEPQVLVLAPTREIAQQIYECFLSIGRCLRQSNAVRIGLFIGGTMMHSDKKLLRQGCQLINDGYLKLGSISLLVLDEADKLMEDSYQQNVNWMFSMMPTAKQVGVFSATYPSVLHDFLGRYMESPTMLRLDEFDVQLLGIKQFLHVLPYPVSEDGEAPPDRDHVADIDVDLVVRTKVAAIVELLRRVSYNQCLIFCNYQDKASMVAELLSEGGEKVEFISAQLDQERRAEVIALLKRNKCRLLVSTDLTARGIDAPNINFVINMETPGEPETYFHRIGRAGRFGGYGAAVSVVMEGVDLRRFHAIGAIGHFNTKALPPLKDVPADLCGNLEYWESRPPVPFPTRDDRARSLRNNYSLLAKDGTTGDDVAAYGKEKFVQRKSAEYNDSCRPAPDPDRVDPMEFAQEQGWVELFASIDLAEPTERADCLRYDRDQLFAIHGAPIFEEKFIPRKPKKVATAAPKKGKPSEEGKPPKKEKPSVETPPSISVPIDPFAPLDLYDITDGSCLTPAISSFSTRPKAKPSDKAVVPSPAKDPKEEDPKVEDMPSTSRGNGFDPTPPKPVMEKKNRRSGGIGARIQANASHNQSAESSTGASSIPESPKTKSSPTATTALADVGDVLRRSAARLSELTLAEVDAEEEEAPTSPRKEIIFHGPKSSPVVQKTWVKTPPPPLLSYDRATLLTLRRSLPYAYTREELMGFWSHIEPTRGRLYALSRFSLANNYPLLADPDQRCSLGRPGNLDAPSESEERMLASKKREARKVALATGKKASPPVVMEEAEALDPINVLAVPHESSPNAAAPSPTEAEKAPTSGDGAPPIAPAPKEPKSKKKRKQRAPSPPLPCNPVGCEGGFPVGEGHCGDAFKSLQDWGRRYAADPAACKAQHGPVVTERRHGSAWAAEWAESVDILRESERRLAAILCPDELDQPSLRLHSVAYDKRSMLSLWESSVSLTSAAKTSGAWDGLPFVRQIRDSGCFYDHGVQNEVPVPAEPERLPTYKSGCELNICKGIDNRRARADESEYRLALGAYTEAMGVWRRMDAPMKTPPLAAYLSFMCRP